MAEPEIRPARREDCAAMAGIYNHYVERDTCTFRTNPESLEERQAWFDQHGADHPVFVAEAEGRVIGWASLNRWNGRCGYPMTVEDSIYLDPAWRGRGMGARLLARLLEAAVARGHHRVIAAISADHARSVALHQRFGFVEVGRMTEVGHKFGRWLDVVYLQLSVPPAQPRAPTNTLARIITFDPSTLPGRLAELSALLLDAVESGASVGFLLPLTVAQAQAYWESAAAEVADQKITVLGAELDGQLVGSVQVIPATRDNAGHRAEIAKLLVHRRIRRRGIGRQLMIAAEDMARSKNRTLLVLDTETGSPAEALYRNLGYTAAGHVPDYARKPEGELRPTTLMWKVIGSDLTLALEDPRQPEVIALIRALDDHCAALYPKESNHFLGADRLAQLDIRFVVARQGGRAVGCGALRIDTEGYGEVKRMFVAPSVRGSGLGRRILERVEAEARAAGLPTLRLEAGTRQPEALGLYRATGYVPCAPFGGYQPDPVSVFLEKHLVAAIEHAPRAAEEPTKPG